MLNLINMLRLNPDIFKDIVIPEGMDKDIMVNTILDVCGECETITYYPELFKAKTEVFFRRNLNQFERLWTINSSEYNPIENYDRKGDINVAYNRDMSVSSSDNSSTHDVQSVTNTDHTTEENKVSAYDEDEYSDNNKLIRDNLNNNNINRENAVTNSRTQTDDIDDNTHTVERVHGNIGVTTTQQMIESEINLWKSYNTYELIAEKYMFSLTITVY